MDAYTVSYYQDGGKYHYGVVYAPSADEAIRQARERVGKEPSGKPGPHPESTFVAEVKAVR